MIETNTLNFHRARAYTAELDLATESLESGRPSFHGRNRARLAYEAIQDLLGKAELEPPDHHAIHGKLRALRTRLEDAGERFPE